MTRVSCFALALFAAPAFAQMPPIVRTCVPMEVWMASLLRDFGEHEEAQLYVGTKGMLVIVVNQKTETWTVGERNAETQLVCTVASGVGLSGRLKGASA